MNNHLVSLMILLPIVGVAVQAFLPRIKTMPDGSLAKTLALLASLASGVCAIALVVLMKKETPDIQHAESFPWIGAYSIAYEVGIDGLSALMVLLIGIVFPILIAYEWTQKSGARGLYALLLIWQAALLGAVCSQDLFLMMFFWALAALPQYFLVSIWGGPERESAGFRLITTATFANALFFVSIVLIYYAAEPHTFLIRDLMASDISGKTLELFGQTTAVLPVAYFLMIVSLALRLAVWPFHGWLVDAARQAPSSAFVAICGAGIPVGLYLFIKLSYVLFPELTLAFAESAAWVGAINVLIGVACAVVQKDLKLALAFLALAEVGMVLIGFGSLDPAGGVGAVYHSFSTGLALAGLGLFAGIFAERFGHTRIGGGGLAARAPWIAVFCGIFVAAFLGFPGFGGFVGRSLVFLGGYSAHPPIIILAMMAMLFAGFGLFVIYRKIFLGGAEIEGEVVADLGLREKLYLLPLVGALVFLGVYPKPLLELMRPTLITLLSLVK